MKKGRILGQEERTGDEVKESLNDHWGGHHERMKVAHFVVSSPSSALFLRQVKGSFLRSYDDPISWEEFATILVELIKQKDPGHFPRPSVFPPTRN